MNLPDAFYLGLVFVVGPIVCLTVGCVIGIVSAGSRTHGTVVSMVTILAVTAGAAGAGLLIQWLEWRSQDQAMVQTVRDQGLIETSRTPEEIRYGPGPGKPSSLFTILMIRRPFAPVWFPLALLGVPAGIVAGGSCATSRWIVRRGEVTPIGRRRAAICSGALGIFAAVVGTATLWITIVRPAKGELDALTDVVEAFGGRGPLAGLSTAELIDRVYPSPGSSASRRSTEWATLNGRFRTGVMSAEEWREVFGREVLVRPILRLRTSVPSNGPIWAEFANCEWISRDATDWQVTVASNLNGATPTIGRYFQGHRPYESVLLGRAPADGDAIEVSITVDEVGGKFHNNLKLRLPIAIGGPTEGVITPVATDALSAWVETNVEFRFDRDATPIRLFAKRLSENCHLRDAPEHVAVGFAAEFRYRGRAVAWSRGFAEYPIEVDSPGISYEITGDTTALATAEPEDSDWQVHVVGDLESALADVEATHGWAGAIDIPLTALSPR